MKIYETLEAQLKKENDFINDDGELKKWVVIGRAQNADETLISLLLDHAELKERFFAEIKGALVFRQNDFVRFIEQKNFLNDSFTAYRNKVGLTIDDKLMTQRNEVALVWPFKDCVLEGGQSREEDKREEIFFNEVLAQDEITQLLEPKVLTNAKVFGHEGEMAFSGFNRDASVNKKRGLGEDTITDNLIVKGNNLLALHSLDVEFSGKVKLIYIDPPYNTGNDSFKYNDNFSRSTWLTFMRNRLLTAKKLLKDDGILCIQCDDKENAYLKLLLDEIFHNGFLNNIAVKMSEASGVKMNHARARFPKLKEYILLYKMPNFSGFVEIDKYKQTEWDQENNIFLEGLSFSDRQELLSLEEKEENNLDDVALANDILKGVKRLPLKKKIAKMQFDNIEDELKWLFDNSYRIIKTAGSASLFTQVKMLKKQPDQEIACSLSKSNSIFTYITDFNSETKQPRLQVIFSDSNIFKNPCDFWQDIKTTGAIADEGGVKLSNGKKPEKILHRLLKMITVEKDIVLDFHLGSGTTAAVAHKMDRQYLGVEQLDYGKNDAVNRIKNVISGDQTGVSKEVSWTGGGSFIYLELKRYNQEFIDRIENAASSKVLLKVWQDMKDKSFLNYNVDLKKQDGHLDDFKALELANQKAHLVSLLDKNQLYVNLSSLEDSDFECSKADKKVTRDFYRLDS
tara:strand:- start:2604 stop:4649 length:2046 start_codon:yes stop_codon:yes gene_type:complete